MNNIAKKLGGFMSTSTNFEVKEMVENTKFLTCAQWVAKHGWPSMGGLRWLIFIAKNDPELRSTFIRVRRRILLKENDLIRYLEKMNERSLSQESKYQLARGGKNDV